MAEHIFVSWEPDSHRYISVQTGGGGVSIPERDRKSHSRYLQGKLKDIWINAKKKEEERLAISLPVRNGTYLEFEGSPEFLLTITSLENKRSGIRLLNTRFEREGTINKATVYVPKGKENYFLKKLEKYEDENTKTGKPKNKNLVASIQDISEALLEAFWIGRKEWLPGDTFVWCEIWIRDDEIDAVKSVIEIIKTLDIEVKSEEISFPERKVILIKANKKKLAELIARCDYIAEIRRATEANSFFVDIRSKDQIEWAQELMGRVELEESNVAVSILDTGINNGNILLNKSIKDEDIHSYFNGPGNDEAGHGTRMAGISAYGDLKDALMSNEQVVLSHIIESMKILPDGKGNNPELFGAITAQSVSNLYIAKPEKERIFCMAVTGENYTYLDGRPSSWSAALDDLIHGTMDNVKKIFIVSAGNIRGPEEVFNYPDSILLNTVEDPGQSWNAITVGAYTNLDTPEEPTYEVIAEKGELSPFSRSSVLFNKIWPIKPEIVFEGGNAVKSGNGGYDDVDLSVLTTHHDFLERTFTTMNATSAATAYASWMAAKIQAEYPKAWAETVRALLIHSADWTNQMKEQFLKGEKKRDYRELLRTCGYGVPSVTRALETAKNRVNLVVESELQPYDKIDGDYKTNEMHIHELPWPKDELLKMLDSEVELKVTLSYFIEPGPGEKGWKDKYRYASSGLRFDLNGTSDKEDFLKRINKAAIDEGEKAGGSSGIGWTLGPGNRDVGSIHSDTWIGTAADLATSNYIGVYPVIGWWRERHHLNKWSHKIRYSLVVSLSTPETEVDLLTPIQTQISTKVETEIEI